MDEDANPPTPKAGAFVSSWLSAQTKQFRWRKNPSVLQTASAGSAGPLCPRTRSEAAAVTSESQPGALGLWQRVASFTVKSQRLISWIFEMYLHFPWYPLLAMNLIITCDLVGIWTNDLALMCWRSVNHTSTKSAGCSEPFRGAAGILWRKRGLCGDSVFFKVFRPFMSSRWV